MENSKNYYRVDTWIPDRKLMWLLEEEDPVVYENINDAISETSNAHLMQPENIYRVVPCQKDGSDLTE